MPYRIELAPELVDKVTAYPLPLQQSIYHALRRLADDPTKLSERARPPDPYGYQRFTFEHDNKGEASRLIAWFQYGDDEKTLHLHDITTESD